MLDGLNQTEMVLTLLEERNKYLELFLEISDRERKAFRARNFENLESLYKTREDILENINSVDNRLLAYSQDMDPQKIDGKVREAISSKIKDKQRLTNAILEQDLVILTCIENEKSNMIKKLTSVRNGRRLLKAYRKLPDIID